MLQEFEQWRFFIDALRIIKIKFFTIIFTLYSVFILYIMLGVNLFGGLINQKKISKMMELNPDASN